MSNTRSQVLHLEAKTGLIVFIASSHFVCKLHLHAKNSARHHAFLAPCVQVLGTALAITDV